MENNKRKDEEQPEKKVVYVVPLDIVLGQLEMVKQSLINNSAQVEIKEKVN